MTAPTAPATVPLVARPWVWVVGALTVPFLLRLVLGEGARPFGSVVLWIGVVGAVVATIAKAHRWATRRTQVVAWVSGIGTLVGFVYAWTRPEYDAGIGDAGLVLLVTMVHVGVAWGTRPPSR
ncbi:hypothetical protein [Aeromicrobium sp. 50.2.37]|uniref:hypothetical protein n=1 Tax=Aeromicrobium sp. 50.2.37 TaxID=2969305 RepID=UPI00214F77A3|nr:hypothetical protein [Aeromicrobium sp. 50.2.37]MCR4514189.1 hypothetical protein [Aeromicrobium sp. 50.2.37]